MLTVTWQQDNQPSDTWTISDDALSSLEKFRLTLLDMKITDGRPSLVPRHETVKDMIVKTFMDYLVTPALTAFPPAEILAAQQALADAKAQYEAVSLATMQTVLQSPVAALPVAVTPVISPPQK